LEYKDCNKQIARKALNPIIHTMADVQSPLPEATSAESKQLSSTVIEPNPSGDYTYYESGMLIPHEAIRLQFARAAKALENLDCNAHMWKAERWNEWIIFFIAMIHSHHDHEEHIFFPHYTALGAQTPKKQFADHKELMALMEEVKSASSMLKVMVERRDSSNDALNEQVQKVRELFLKLKTVTEEHLAEEETFWPNAMKMYGEVTLDVDVLMLLVMHSLENQNSLRYPLLTSTDF
jgi:hemerythrin superfamily protein